MKAHNITKLTIKSPENGDCSFDTSDDDTLSIEELGNREFLIQWVSGCKTKVYCSNNDYIEVEMSGHSYIMSHLDADVLSMIPTKGIGIKSSDLWLKCKDVLKEHTMRDYNVRVVERKIKEILETYSDLVTCKKIGREKMYLRKLK